MKTGNLPYVYRSILCKECRRRIMEQELKVRPNRRISDLAERDELHAWLEAHPNLPLPVSRVNLTIGYGSDYPEGGTRYE